MTLVTALACGSDDSTDTTPLATTAPTAVPQPADTPTPAPPKVDRLLIALTTPSWETTIPWIASTVRTQHKAIFEPLVGTTRGEAAYTERLATSWSMSTDGKTWTVDLKEGIPFHQDYGEFTAQDFVHSWVQQGVYGMATDHSRWHGHFESASDFDISNDHRIVMNLHNPEPEMVYFMAVRNGNLLMGSKAQWDAVGESGMAANPAGTGPWTFNSWQKGSSMLLDRVDNHWRQTPNFKELFYRFVDEDATRLAMMLTNESHISDLPRSLHGTAQSSGLTLVEAAVPSSAAQWNFGGQYLGCTVEGRKGCTPDKYDPTNPLTKLKVRQAIVHSIDRQEILETIYNGMGDMASVSYDYHIYDSYNPRWDAEMEEHFKYDPELSRRLLAEAGYPDGFDLTIISHNWTGWQEYKQTDQAFQLYFQDVGINATIEEAEWARTKQKRGKAELGAIIYGLPPYNLGPPSFIEPKIYGADGKSFLYTHPDIDTAVDQLKDEIDPVKRASLVRTIGDTVFDNYGDIVLFYSPQILVIDPNIVADFQFPGTYTDGFADLEYIKRGPGAG